MCATWVNPEDVYTALQQQLSQDQSTRSDVLLEYRRLYLKAMPFLVGVSRFGGELEGFETYWRQSQKRA